MDRALADLNDQNANPCPGRRPRDLALLLLAIGADSPRARARDQQADLAGAELQRRVLDRLAALDPEPDALGASLAAIVAELGPPTGPTRAIAAQFVEEWAQLRAAPGAWAWLVSEALERSAEGENQGRRKGRSRGTA
jgi:hypothetical protein